MHLNIHAIDPVVRDIAAQLGQHGHEAFVVGGAVRDLLLGIRPKDYDIATSARPEQVKHVFGRRALIIGRRFRLVHLRLGAHVYEISTFRREPTAEERSTRVNDDGVMIWSDNQFGTHEQDAVRRDFTVNALYYDPRGEGRIIDHVGGVADLRNRLVRTIGAPDVRLPEDPVRLLRAMKLVAQYGFTLEASLDAAVRDLAPRIALSSKSRCFEELLKILAKPHALATFRFCHEYGILAHYFANLNAAWEGSEGAPLRQLLQWRDSGVANGLFAQSKTLGLATLAFAPVAAALRAVSGTGGGCLWNDQAGVDSVCRDAVRKFFLPFAVPRFLQGRVRDVILMQPFFLSPEPLGYVVRHPQYRYGRELCRWLTESGLMPDGHLDCWPSQEEVGHDFRTHGPRRRRNRPWRGRKAPGGEFRHAGDARPGSGGESPAGYEEH